MTDLLPLIRDVLPAVRQLRHALHAHPELAFEEIETSRKVAEVLQNLPDVTIRKGVARTGVVATLGADKPGPCVALRADMDALPITEQTGVAYASTRPGLMHACGHDGHTAALLGAAMVLARVRDELQGPVRFLFQPGEEGRGGARIMLDEGALDEPRAEAVFGAHNWPANDLQAGDVALRAGALMGGSADFQITIRGRGGHAAMPHRAIDPISIGAQIINAAQTIVARETNPVDVLVITFGQFHAGSASNIIPETARLEGTIRSLSPALLRTVPGRLQRLAEAIAAAHGASAEVALVPGYPVVLNDAAACRYVSTVARSIARVERVIEDYEPVLASEDFAFYQEARPGAFYFLGARPDASKTMPFLHHPQFDYNDGILALAIEMHCELARRFAAEWKR